MPASLRHYIPTPCAAVLLPLLLLAGCAQISQQPTPPEKAPTQAAAPLQAAKYDDLPGWPGDDLALTFQTFVTECASLQQKALWRTTCTDAQLLADTTPDNDTLRQWFETNLRPWQLVNPDGSKTGLITGYYEPVLQGNRTRTAAYTTPLFGVPDDLIVVDLGALHPELKSMRLRGRIVGRKLIPYYSRAEWTQQQEGRTPLVWVNDSIDAFFMEIQGSGQIALDDGSRIRLNYADQNGYSYKSIGRWLIDQGELKPEQASMQGIKDWARKHPERLQELLNVNPSLVFFREIPAEGTGPQGAMGLALTPERSLAVDARTTPLGTPVWLATTQPNSATPLQRLMLAQDTGGAIRGVVRADFYWGSGPEAGAQAGRMKQSGRMWLLLPRNYTPPDNASADNNAPQ